MIQYTAPYTIVSSYMNIPVWNMKWNLTPLPHSACTPQSWSYWCSNSSSTVVPASRLPLPPPPPPTTPPWRALHVSGPPPSRPGRTLPSKQRRVWVLQQPAHCGLQPGGAGGGRWGGGGAGGGGGERGEGGLGNAYILSMLVANTAWLRPNNQDLEIPSFEYSCDISNVVVMHWKARGRGGLGAWGLGGLGAWGMHIYCQCWSPILYCRHQN